MELPARSSTAKSSGADALGIAALFALMGLCAVFAFISVREEFVLSGLAAASAFGVFGVFWGGWNLRKSWLRSSQIALVEDVFENEKAYCFLADEDSQIILANQSARERFVAKQEATLSAVLRDVFAGSEGIVFRLQQKALTGGAASEDITSHAEGFRVNVRKIGSDLVLWRLEVQAGSKNPQKSSVPILSLGRNGAILFMNAPARELIGQRPKSLGDVVVDLPLQDGAVHHLKTDPVQRVLVHTSELSGGRMEISLAPLPDETPAEDLSGNFDNLPVPLLRVAPDGAILRVNAEARTLLDLGTSAPGNITEHMEGLGRAIRDWLVEAAEGRGLNRSEFLRLTRSDREVFVQVTLNRVIEEGEAHLVAVLNDATELKTLEAQFVQSQKMQAIGQLAGGVAHDFNNLLTAISGHCDLLLLRHDQGDHDYADLVQINQNANRAAALVGQLLAFSRKQTLQPETLDLRDTLADLAHLLNRLVGEKVRLTLRHDPVLPAVRGDRRQLEQVMMNLVVNARDAMPEGGEIVIETERRVLREPLQRDRAVVAPGTYVSVRVTDEGVGIPKDKLQKVFEPFFTTKRTGEGTGLGLSTVYGIVKQTGGFIFVDSIVGQGTCFTLLFPSSAQVSEETAPAVEVEEKKTLPQKGSGVVLLVEDEAPVRAFAARALRLRGYEVVEAETAEDALSKLEDDSFEVDIFVTDVVMPGMDGPSWVRIAREKRPDTCVVFMSGYAEDVFGEGSDDVPNSVFLPKPFSLSDLTETVHKQLN
ncbi:MAG: ATP-binding protein [Pelagimonas sp.]|nr:ATP-binding protein [Pelagimonas sp.]